MRLALASALLFFVSAAASDAGAPGAKVPVSAGVTLAGAPEAPSGAKAQQKLRERFGIHHVTLQIEPAACSAACAPQQHQH